MRKILTSAVVLLGLASSAFAQLPDAVCRGGNCASPEINAASAVAAMGLVAGVVLVLRSRRNRQRQST
jgi:predicted S18 family serine protease